MWLIIAAMSDYVSAYSKLFCPGSNIQFNVHLVYSTALVLVLGFEVESESLMNKTEPQ